VGSDVSTGNSGNSLPSSSQSQLVGSISCLNVQICELVRNTVSIKITQSEYQAQQEAIAKQKALTAASSNGNLGVLQKPAVKQANAESFVTVQNSSAYTLPPIFAKIKQCESGNDPVAQNPHSTASGLYQVLNSTWNNYDGYARAMYAPPAVQEQFALELYTRRGTEPWISSSSCWQG
jgi:hypothetical protein